MSSCASSSVVLFNKPDEAAHKQVENQPEKIGVYRSQHPYNSFTEFGLISFKTEWLDLPTIYAQLRRDGAKQNADDIVDVKIKGETHNETSTERKCTQKTECSPEGACTTIDDCHDETTSKEVSTYTIEGSLIRRTP